MPLSFHQILRGIGKTCESTPLTEAEVEKLFQEREFFLRLGYLGIGKDILAQRSRAQKRYDLALLSFGGRVRSVMEFKKTAVTDLGQFKDELDDKYVKPHLATFGVLTNGIWLLVYARVNGSFVKQLEKKLSELTEPEVRELEAWLRKPAVDLEQLESVLEVLRRNRKEPLLISDVESEGARVFFQVFQLSPGSAFGRLVEALRDLLPKSIAVSKFTRGSYEFWQKTYARKLQGKEAPTDWKPFLLGVSTEQVARLSFALETAYTIVSRLMLAKAADDRGFPGVRFVPRIHESFSELSTRGRLTPEHHLEVVRRSFQRAGDVLFHSIFLQDIFDWWLESPAEGDRNFLLALGEAALMVTQFDFSELSGDLLGQLYQHYFDRDTRKALGEFYTPAEIIEFILDECGYEGRHADRLLDPACGSGSFLVAALRRYLRQHQGADKKNVLLDLTEGLRIVGFDINPFAVLMAQVNYAAMILPLYAEAAHEDREFHILRLPVFRTDSLRMEEREEEPGKTDKDGLQVSLQFQPATLTLTVYLPIEGAKRKFLKMPVLVPRYHEARRRGLVGNLEDYVAAVARVFQAARDKRRGLDALLHDRFGDRAEGLADYLGEALVGLNGTIAELQGKYSDGRFLKTIEDLVLAVSLKHDMSYEFVVGNPPYVRVQKIPEHVKEYWEEKYEWAERNYDLFVPFLERALRSGQREGWLANGGKLGYILSDRFLNVDYGAKLREEMPKHFRPDLLLDFRDTRVFADALNYPAIVIGERGSDGREGEMEAARIFASDADLPVLLAEFRELRQQLKPHGVERGRALEVFRFPRRRLSGPGWWLMPADEVAVFEKLRRAPGKRLTELSATSSGGFAGYQTSADGVFVLHQRKESNDLLEVTPNHETQRCGCAEAGFPMEKAALRPFLFGKDVGRWRINWKRTWVLFPYDVYRKKKSLFQEEPGTHIAEEWNLIPSKKNLDHFEFAEPDEIQTIEERFRKTWKYLKRHETELRKRENDKYGIGSVREELWYEATYPRSLDFYFKPKIVVQLLSRRNSFALDGAGKFVFQGGGKGGGVYGISPNANVESLEALAAFMNSRLADFLVKQVTSVYGSRFYSYADQFLRELPVAEAFLSGSSSLSKSAAALFASLTTLTERRCQLAGKIERFPSSFDQDLSRFELQQVEKLSVKSPGAAHLTVEAEAIAVEPTLLAFAVHYGGQTPFEFQEREHAECLAEALRVQGKRSVTRNEVMGWRLPAKPAGCAELLRLLKKAQGELRVLREKIAQEEERLNDLVYEAYGLNAGERQVVEAFLDRYTSQSSGEAAETAVESLS